MGFLDALFSRNATRDWPPSRATPDFDTLSNDFGALRFGGPFASASFLGPSDGFRGDPRKTCTLRYARGFDLDFEEGRLMEVTFYISGHLPSDVKGMTFSQPRLSNGHRLGADWDRARIVSVFGEPTDSREDDEDAVLNYDKGPIILEFLLEPRTLTQWTVYVND